MTSLNIAEYKLYPKSGVIKFQFIIIINYSPNPNLPLLLQPLFQNQMRSGGNIQMNHVPGHPQMVSGPHR